MIAIYNIHKATHIHIHTDLTDKHTYTPCSYMLYVYIDCTQIILIAMQGLDYLIRGQIAVLLLTPRPCTHLYDHATYVYII